MLPSGEDADMKVSEILARKSSGKKRPGPVPPRRTTSVKDQLGDFPDLDMELKSRMKLQKAKMENATFTEEQEMDRSGKVDSTVKLEDSSAKNSADILKAAQIDRSKYLISEANARTFEHGTPERSSARKMGLQEKRSGKGDESGEGQNSPVGGQYPKKAIPLPQRPSTQQLKKMSESQRPMELMHSTSIDEGVDQQVCLQSFLLCT